MATINEFGAAIKTLLEYKADIEAKYLTIDNGWNIEPESPDGQAIAIWSELFANLDEQVIAAYRSVDPDTAIGQQLDRISYISGVERQAGTFSTATVTFSGTNGSTIPEGTQVRNEETDTLWATDQAVSIASGTATVGVTCTTVGPEPAGVGDLSIIATPVSGVSSVTNSTSASLGNEREPDAVFRARRARSVAALGSNQVDSMFGAVANVADVKHTRIYENDTNSADANGLEAHSIAIFVDGGDTAAIANAVARKKSPGVSLNAGSGFANVVTEQVATEQGSVLAVTIFRPVLQNIFVDISLAGDIPTGAAADIKQAIVDYANAELFESGATGFDLQGFSIGDTVPVGKLFTPVNRVLAGEGYAADIKIGTSSGAINQTLIDPGFNGLAVFDIGNITVS